ncbi:hypothetical protein PM082_015439 [Marasmius tenuissimus]|nr:hypothetical protein PM082_015439 [Marasmius tenuissimus]
MQTRMGWDLKLNVYWVKEETRISSSTNLKEETRVSPSLLALNRCTVTRWRSLPGQRNLDDFIKDKKTPHFRFHIFSRALHMTIPVQGSKYSPFRTSLGQRPHFPVTKIESIPFLSLEVKARERDWST